MTAQSKLTSYHGTSLPQAGLFVTITQALAVWAKRRRARRALARLDDRLLRDIGLDRATAENEASRRFWQD